MTSVEISFWALLSCWTAELPEDDVTMVPEELPVLVFFLSLLRLLGGAGSASELKMRLLFLSEAKQKLRFSTAR